MADLSLDELKEKLKIAQGALQTIADTKKTIMGFYDEGESPPVEMMLAGLTGATRLARESLAKMAEIDLKLNNSTPHL